MRFTAVAMMALAWGMLIQPVSAQPIGDVAAGEAIFKRCMTCHSVKPGENKVGPSLHGVVGRLSHSVEGFAYSDAMKAYDVTWDQSTLDSFLHDPRGIVPRTRMLFPGLRSETERANVIAYLATLQ